MARIFSAFLMLSLVSTTADAQLDPDDLLPPDQAFRVQGEMLDADTARFSWEIAEGYYLYRSKTRVETDTDRIEVGEPVLPEGKHKHDDYFGEIETYRHRLRFEVPVERLDPTANEARFIVKSQGCADVGVCYPPQARRLTLALPPMPAAAIAPVSAAPAAAAEASGPGDGFSLLSAGLPGLGGRNAGLSGDLSGGLDDGLSGEDEEFLDPDRAFVVSARLQDPGTVAVVWNIADGYYLYRHRLKFALLDADGYTLGEAIIPSGEQKEDEFFGTVETYHHKLTVTLPVTPVVPEGRELTLQVNYQGCAEAGLCYPPQTKTLPLILGAGAGPGAASAQGGTLGASSAATAEESTAPVRQVKSVSPAKTVEPAAEGAPLSESDSIAATLAGGNTGLILLTFFGFGLLLTFTPCVFPMIPILSSIIVGQGSDLNTGRAFVMSLVYVLAMALTYTVAGVIAGLAGGNLQAAFQNPWVLGSFAAVFVLLSLSMFGFYELQLPSSLQSRLTEASNRQQGGTLIGVAIMGLLSALIVGPCVAPPLMGALIYIGNSGDAVLGGLALFVMSLGMGAPLLIIGTLGGSWLPRAGAWMDGVKAVFGVMLLGVAIWMLERIIPGPVSLLLWAMLFLVSAVYMGALDSLHQPVSGWRRLSKGLGLVFLVYGVLLLIGAATGGDDMFRPLQPLRSVVSGTQGNAVAAPHVSFQRVRGVDGLDAALQDASRQGKPVLLDFYADWCVECKRMERYTFADPAVVAALDGVLLLQADVTENNALDEALLRRYSLLGPPALLFFDTQGKEMRAWRFVGFKDVDEFVQHVNGAYRRGD